MNPAIKGHQVLTVTKHYLTIILIVSISNNLVLVVPRNCLNAGTHTQISSWWGWWPHLGSPDLASPGAQSPIHALPRKHKLEPSQVSVWWWFDPRALSWIVAWIGAPTMVCLDQAKGVAYLGCLSTTTKERLEHWIKKKHPCEVEWPSPKSSKPTRASRLSPRL
jgi:hypothetical protein